MKKWTKNLHIRRLILDKIIEYFESTKSNKIRRGQLKNVCEDIADTLGGAFDRALCFLEDEGVIEQEKDKAKNTTLIIFNISKARNFRNILSYPEAFLIPLEIITHEDLENEFTKKGLESIWEEAVDDIIFSALTKLKLPSKGDDSWRYGNQLIQRLIALLTALAASRNFSFNLKGTRNNFSYLMSKDAILELARSAFTISSKNPQESFKITIEYNGIANPLMAIEALTPEIIDRANPCLLEFCKEYLKFDFNDQDKNHLAKGNIDQLSARGFEYVQTFWKYYVFPFIPIYSKLLSG